jgi:hypothetical protein
MEQARGARELEQVEAWVEAAVARAGEEVAGALEVVLRQDRVDIVSVATAAKEQPINWEAPVISSNAQNVEWPWPLTIRRGINAVVCPK